MYIIDSNGQRIEVRDVNTAIKQTELFVDFRHEDKEFKRLDEVLHAYWQDVLNKLEVLKNVQQENEKTTVV